MLRVFRWLFGENNENQRVSDVPIRRNVHRNLGNKERDRISNIFKARSLMSPIKVRHYGHQDPAPKSNIFELLSMGPEHYYLKAIDPDSHELPMVDGLFIFVILASSPGKVLCGVPKFDIMANRFNQEKYGIYGHTSLSLRDDVLYAGEIYFGNGVLCMWTNKSGHYKPMAQTRLTNIIPSVQRILIPDAFVDHQSPPKWFIDALYGE